MCVESTNRRKRTLIMIPIIREVDVDINLYRVETEIEIEQKHRATEHILEDS